MLSYRHVYHAGNHADVFKHLVLTEVLRYLVRKDKPFWYIDTHAGAGRYQLEKHPASAHAEYLDGVERLWLAANPPDNIAPYLTLLRQLNPGRHLQQYPGSPWFAAAVARPGDRLWLYELHPRDHQSLAREFAGRREVKVACQDGFQGLHGLLPPAPRRGVVLIDPSYEVGDDYRQVVIALENAIRQFPTGIFLLWLPRLSRPEVPRLERRLKTLPVTNWLQASLNVRSPAIDGFGMFGSTMHIINPPYRLREFLSRLLPWLVTVLGQDGHASFALDGQGTD